MSQTVSIPDQPKKRRYWSGCRYLLILLAGFCGTFLSSTFLFAEEFTKPSEEQLRFFESKIRPLLLDSCVDCHSADLAESDLRLDTFSGMIKGGKAGPSVVPGKPKSSLLITAIGYQDATLQMPPENKLSDQQIADLTRWVEMGAPHPESNGEMVPEAATGIDLEQGRQHWAYRSVERPEIPEVKNQSWVTNPIDAFVLNKLEEEELTPATPTDKRTLIRRATFDLTGLPPTPEEISSFLNDDSPEAFARVIDRLLESPHYGERWGRHWLDVVRYADSNGLDENVAHGNAWKYRDYVVNAFNKDKPYDQFLTEQLAGDLLDSGDDHSLRHERLTATGFLSLGPKVLAEVDKVKMEMDIIDEQIDTIGRSLMGVTMGCARCHDHKFDPIGTSDYYALAGIFKSTHIMESFKTVARWNENRLTTPELDQRVKAHSQKVADKKKEIEKLLSTAKAELQQRLGPDKKLPTKPETELTPAEKEKLKQLRAEQKQLGDQAPVIPTAMGVKEGKPQHLPVHIRGSHLTLGETIQRGFPELLAGDAPFTIPDDQSGRLQFAQWLTRPDHPLTTRVMVNRIWRWHFGEGIVSTPDNFGLQGEPPSNQPLLDWLALAFQERGYSLKEIHRLIMLSSTYRMSSRYDEQNASIDPENKYFWRANIKRLEAESIRDALLAVSGNLDPEFGGNLLNVKNRAFVFNHESKENVDYNFSRRSIYLPVIRNHLHPVFQLFDYSDASVINGNRQTSTVATQALYLMNAPFMDEQTKGLAKRIRQERSPFEDRLELLYETCYGRLPTKLEADRAVLFLDQIDQSLTQKVNDPAKREQTSWEALCQAILSSHEFCYLR